MPEVAGEKITVRCASCAAGFRVPASAAGKRGKCPKCAAVFRVPVPDAEDAAPNPGLGDDLLSGLDSGEVFDAPLPISAATRSSGGGGIRPCPSCGAAMGGGAVVCTGCGYNTQSGRTVKGGTLAGATAGAALAGAAGVLNNPYLRGTVFSAVGAALGGAVWFGVAYGTNFEIGWIAWLVGALAGVGMNLGFRNSSPVAGLIAAALAVGAISGARLLVLDMTIDRVVAGFVSEKSPRVEMIDILKEQKMEGVEIEGDPGDRAYREALVKAEEQAIGAATAEVDRMGAVEVERRINLLHDEFKTELRKLAQSEQRKNLFSLFNILFYGLAIATAFKVGMNGFGAG